MEFSTLSALAWKHTRNAVAEEAYLRTGYDGTKPVTFYGPLTNGATSNAAIVSIGGSSTMFRR